MVFFFFFFFFSFLSLLDFTGHFLPSLSGDFFANKEEG